MADLPAPTNAGLFSHQTLMDMIKSLDVPPIDWKVTMGKAISPRSFKPPYLIPTAPWQPAASIQAQDRLQRAQSHHITPPIYDFTLPPGGVDLKFAADMMKHQDQMIRDAMLGKGYGMDSTRGRLQGRREYPDTTAGLEEAMRLDCEYNVDFGLVIHNQADYDADVIERWIWGPNGEFTGFPAGDEVFDTTWRELRNHNVGAVSGLFGYERFPIQFNFRPRYTRQQLADNRYIYDDYKYHDQYRTRRSPPYAVSFYSYADQAQWGALAKQQARDMMNGGQRGQNGF